jgi:hypothetical protein
MEKKSGGAGRVVLEKESRAGTVTKNTRHIGLGQINKAARAAEKKSPEAKATPPVSVRSSPRARRC